MSVRQPQAVAVDVCPLCGGPRTDWGCRPVALGDWCRAKGLKEDQTRRPPAPVDPVAVKVAASPAVKAAERAVDAALLDLDAATSRWEAAALAGWQARARQGVQSQVLLVDGVMRTLVPAGATDRDIRRLADAEAEADVVRREAAERVITLRRELDEAQHLARRMLKGRL